MDFQEQLYAVKELQNNCNNSPPPSPSIIQAVRETISVMEELKMSPRSIQQTSYGVAITFLNGTKYADLEFCEDNEAVVLMEDLRDREETIFELPSRRPEIKDALEKIRGFLVEEPASYWFTNEGDLI